MTHNIVVVVAGTAGAIASTFLKSHWKDKVDITLIYDHKNPGIGVGESTTPIIFDYLQGIGIDDHDLLKNTNSTYKIGIKFKNWLNDNKHYYHGFAEFATEEEVPNRFNSAYAYEVTKNTKYLNFQYDSFYYEKNILPYKLESYAIHIDTLSFSNYIQSLFKDRITILDGVVKKVNVDSGKIDSIVLSDGREIKADIYIDDTGFSGELIKHLNPKWVDKSDYIPNNRAIPFHIKKEYDYIPPYTLAEASPNGWIWQIPLFHRFGSGYLFSDKFTDVEDAKKDYNKWLMKNHNIELDSDRVIKFDSGYWENPWIGNCVAIGLSSGFVEPLESTSVHMSILQTITFMLKYPLETIETNISQYNKYLAERFEEIYDFVRYHYFTKRTDSPFWRYMTENTPEWILNLENKIKKDFLRSEDFIYNAIFDYQSYSAVSHGLKIFTPEDAAEYLKKRNLESIAVTHYNRLRNYKMKNRDGCVDHKEYIESVKYA